MDDERSFRVYSNDFEDQNNSPAKIAKVKSCVDLVNN